MSYAKNIYMDQCEKRSPFRHGPLLPENRSLLILKLLTGRLILRVSVQLARFSSPRFGKMTISVPTR